MKFKKFIALSMACVLAASALTGCGKKDGGKYTEFTMFSAMPGSEINDGNEVQELIAEKTGVKVKESWLVGQEAVEAVGSIIASGDLPDFIDGGDGMGQLYDAGLLVAWDDYIEKYPNLKELYTPAEWENFRQEDGHIYWANVFCNHYGEELTTGHNDEAFWIQCRVLAWDNYPQINTLDEYFDLLERYYAANPTMEDGTAIIPYTCLCEDWRYFCIENAPEFLAGYPNDGSVIVNTTDFGKPTIVDYNTIPEAKEYFGKLNEEWNKGMIDPEFATQTWDEYIAKLSTGRVLGMCDQNWDFNNDVSAAFKTSGLDLLGCNYIPLGLTIEEGQPQQWHAYGDTLNNSSGCAVTTSCKDPDAAFKFLSDILEQDIHNLRFWGVEGVDYLVDENGLFYRTEEMRANCADTAYQASHLCAYGYMPQWLGTSRDGINAMMPSEQPSEFMSGMAEPLKATFDAYGYTTYPEFIGSAVVETGPWYPMYSFSNAMTPETAGGEAWTNMGKCKHEYLPMIVMAEDFDAAWEEYMAAYNDCNPQAFLDEMQEELDRRVAQAEAAQ